jgi:hypothetical protein
MKFPTLKPGPRSLAGNFFETCTTDQVLEKKFLLNFSCFSQNYQTEIKQICALKMGTSVFFNFFDDPFQISSQIGAVLERYTIVVWDFILKISTDIKT